MPTPIRLLIIEDSEDDARLLVHTLERGGFAPAWQRVCSAEALRAALGEHAWDIAVSDHAMPGFSAPEALTLVKALQPALIFIIVSGEMDLPLAVSAMKAGAQDFISKHNLAQVVPALTRELREADMRRERQRAEAALRESEARYRALAEENAALLEQARRDAETKSRLLQEVNHRVKNNLAAIIGLLYAHQHGTQPTPISAQVLASELVSQITGLAKVHDMLSAAEWSPLPLDHLARQIIATLLSATPSFQHITVEVTPSPVKVSPRQANSLALILNELTTNTLKYALRGRPAAQIRLGIATMPEAGLIELEYSNDGPGYPASVLSGQYQTTGLYLVESLMTYDLKGSLELRNTPHPVAILRFKSEAGDLAASLAA